MPVRERSPAPEIRDTVPLQLGAMPDFAARAFDAAETGRARA